jgi:speckle-type POZ protein
LSVIDKHRNCLNRLVVDISPHIAVNDRANRLAGHGYPWKTYENGKFPVTRFTKHVKLYSNATICIDGKAEVRHTPGGKLLCNEFQTVLQLRFSKVEDDSPADLTGAKISLLFGTYKKDCWDPSMCIFKEKSWGYDGVRSIRCLPSVYFRHQYDDKMSPEEIGNHFQIKLVIKIPRKTGWTLAQDVQKLFSNRDFSDVTIVCGEKEEKFECHKAILAVRSKVFYAMFNMVESSENQTGVVKVDDVDAKTMKSLLKYIYKNQVEPEDVDGDLLLAADKYDLPGLVSQCKNKVGHILSTENIFGILMASRMLDLNDINELAMKWIRQWSNDIQCGDQWNKLKSENPDLAKEVEQNWILEAALPKTPPWVKGEPFPPYEKMPKLRRWMC